MHYIKHLLLIIIITGSLGIQAKDNPSDSQQLGVLLEPITSLSAEFEQRTIDANGIEVQRASGIFQIAQPSNLRWTLTDPMPQQVISDGQTLWLYDEDLEQVIVQPFENNFDATPALLFSGDLQQLNLTYHVSRISEGSFELRPKQNDSLFASIQLHFDNTLPRLIILTDNLGQTTKITLADVSLNPAISADQFTFQIPDHIDVIRND